MRDSRMLDRQLQLQLVGDVLATAEARFGEQWDRQMVHQFALNAVTELLSHPASITGYLSQLTVPQPVDDPEVRRS